MIQIDSSKFKAFIFDMDGTMVDSIPWHKKSYEALFEKLQLPFSETFYKEQIVGHKNSEIFPKLFPDKESDELQKLIHEKESIFREIYRDHITEIEGLSKFLNKSHAKGMLLAIATTAPRENRTFYFEKLKLNKSYFSAVVGDEEVIHGKPNPAIYFKVANKLSVQPEVCLVFEDSRSGIKAAKSAGMTVVGLSTNNMPDILKEADYVINNFLEIELL